MPIIQRLLLKFIPLTAGLLLSQAVVAQTDATALPSLAGKRIAVSVTGTSHYFDIKVFQAQVDEIKRLGGTPITLDAGRSDKNLVTQLQTLVTQKPDAVIQTLGTLSVIEPWLKRISRAGIPLFTIDAPSQYSLSNTTSDNAASGKALAEQLIADAGGQGKILVFNGFYGVPACAIRYDQLKLALKDYPQLQIIQPELRDVIPNTVQDAYAQISALLNKYPPGSVKAIWAAWDIPQLGASKAVLDARRSEIKTYGVDGTPEVLALMAQPNSPVGAVVAQQPELIGRTAVQNVARYLSGERDLPKESYVPTLLTTAANLPQVKQLRGE
ncbi:sugar ABC transporter substrate-binding protein [Pseudomonas sp. 5P_3.1_Bac2]|uniref:sugar ABC transporter substrate-binding protein n=1 Tax=Pseudomonas sp. 5P_3.1_Bac2 TaxID=2971617 RepID=UPI0021C9A236|nr:sugar ABC transporter substrate-binding protein [Pseudomonas sp. 5P_3.1_Bac2]MCU1718341.1 sugar ABC transporter substrate-binding protein [Pseudomonas sp. 5P_3.1_Bac2]